MKKWKTKDGAYISVSKLETSHIKNILKGFDDGKSFGTAIGCISPEGEVAYEDNRDEWRGILEDELNRRSL